MNPTNNKNIAKRFFSLSTNIFSYSSRWQIFFVCGWLLLPAEAQCSPQPSTDLYNLSLEELGNIKVTSVSKNEERLAHAAASVYLISNEAIRRAGARTIPEALRLAPTLQVAQINAYKYAISARGFNSNTANKLLVMIDGRTIYNPLFSGVSWESQDILLEDVDRIEVISGPGGTLWGANAVNGVINIITRSAKKTEGNLLRANNSNKTRGVAFRHGESLDEGMGDYRVYAKFDKHDHSTSASGRLVDDAWDRGQVGFRTDWKNQQNDFTVQGDAYQAAFDTALPEQQENSGINLLGRWTKALNDGASLRVQTYFDHTSTYTPATYSEKLNTLDIDIQHSVYERGTDELIWGGGYRISDDRVGNTDLLAFLPAHRQLEWANIYLQQKRDLGNHWMLTLGAKVESNEYTGAEFLPKATLAWQVSDEDLMWVRISRAVRAPSRVDKELYLSGNPPYTLAGGANFRSEIVNTLELGWRAQQGQSFYYSVVAFHNDYDHLRSLNNVAGGPSILGNSIDAQSNGVETTAHYQLSPTLAFSGGAVFLNQRMSKNAVDLLPTDDPRSQWNLGSTWQVNQNQQLHLAVRHVGELPSPRVAAYTSLDAHFDYRLTSKIQLTLSGRNLNDSHHEEFALDNGVVLQDPIQIEREIDLSLRMHF